MKKLIIALVVLIGFTATAQKGKGKLKSQKEKLTIEQRATLQTKKMTLALDLNPSQQQQVKALHVKNAEMRKTKMEERKARKENKDAQKPSSEDRYAMQIERLDHQIAQKAAMKKILSKEQMEKWEQLASHKKRKHKKGRKGPGKETK